MTGRRKSDGPVAVTMTKRDTGEEFFFWNYTIACEFLHRSVTYMKIKACDVPFNEEIFVTNKWNEEFILKKVGHGRRRDAVAHLQPKKENKHIPEEERYKIQHQLCTSCARAVGFCSWSKRLEPVEGWDATPTNIKAVSNNTAYTSYRIKACPLYIQDGKTKEEQRQQRQMLLEERRIQNG